MHHVYEGEEWKRADNRREPEVPPTFREKLHILNLRYAYGYINQLDWSASFDHLMMPEKGKK